MLVLSECQNSKVMNKAAQVQGQHAGILQISDVLALAPVISLGAITGEKAAEHLPAIQDFIPTFVDTTGYFWLEFKKSGTIFAPTKPGKLGPGIFSQNMILSFPWPDDELTSLTT